MEKEIKKDATTAAGFAKGDVAFKKLSNIKPRNYPFDTFLRNNNPGYIESDINIYEFYSIVNRGTKCKVGTKVTAAETDSPIKITLSEGCHAMSKDGCLLVPSYNVPDVGATPVKVSSGLALHPLVLHIVAIDYVSKEITVVGINGKCPALEADTELFRMGSAKDQDAAMSEDPMATPTKDRNYVQRNLCTISENAFQALQEKEVAYGMAEFKEQALLDFRYQAEMTTLFGSTPKEPELIDPISQKRKLFMRGLFDFNINNFARTTGSNEEKIEHFLNRAMEGIFSCNNGSESRLLLYGPGFATKIADSGVWQKQLEATHTEIRFGITWKIIETNFGQLLGIMHPGLGLVGPYTNAGIVIDPANIRRINQQETVINFSKKVTLVEAWTLEVTAPQAHALLSI